MITASETTNGSPTLLRMTEDELKAELKKSLLVLTSTSPDKRDIYRLLISSLGKDTEHHAGLNLYFTDSGALGIAPRQTEENTGYYTGNLEEKWRLQLAKLSSPETQQLIRLKLMASGEKQNEFNPETVNIMGMTEDSGIELLFNDKEIEKKFIDNITAKLKVKLRPKDHHYLNELHETGFPGPNLKPFLERLEGGFNELMTIMYDTADELKIKELRFGQTVRTCFVSPRLGKYYDLEFKSQGRLLTRDEYTDRVLASPKGEAININFVQVFDGQANGAQKTLDVLINEGLHTRASKELPVNYPRRDLIEHLQGLIGKRRSSRKERDRHVQIAYATPRSLEDKHESIMVNMPVIRDYTTVGLPTRDELIKYPHIKTFNGADVIVLMPEKHDDTDKKLKADPNHGMLLNIIVTAVTEPEAMGIPIVLDNRTKEFNPVLELISDDFAQGRLLGDRPFYVANTDDELKHILLLLKDVKQRAPVIRSPVLGEDTGIKHELSPAVPADGVFSVFVGGGHATNADRDRTDARTIGYFCAQNGWRIITGAGSIEGSMGEVHTGFIQYHLDKLKKMDGHEGIKARLAEYIDKDNNYDAEDIIKNKPGLIEEMAKPPLNLIPRNMFYGYSMKPLLEMESHSGTAPPGITYFDDGNRVRRLKGLLASGTKILMPGSIGTAEEFWHTVDQHLKARLSYEAHGADNANTFKDGTADNDGTLIIYNRGNTLNTLLKHYNLFGDDAAPTANRKRNNIIVINSLEELKAATQSTASTWQERISKASEPGLAALVA